MEPSIQDLQAEIKALKARLLEKEHLLQQQQQQKEQPKSAEKSTSSEAPPAQEWPLTLDEYERYGRQLLVPEISLLGQQRLRAAHVLVVGCGGLGCPAVAYLAGAGVGTLGLVDGDVVEKSNLHRQVMHSEKRVGMLKVRSVGAFVEELNGGVRVVEYGVPVGAANVFDILEGRDPGTGTKEGNLKKYDLVLDCTDNPATRYLLNDAAVIAGIPLVSAAALKTEGQLSVLNFKGGPCYRCLFPVPPPPESVVACGDGGVVGPVVGLMGVWQAVEAIKILTGAYDVALSSSTTNSSLKPAAATFTPSLHLFSAYSFPPFRSVKLRSRKPSCAACGTSPTVTRASIESGSFDYAFFCSTSSGGLNLLDADERISVLEYQKVRESGLDHTVLDVRVEGQFLLCALPGSVHIPYSQLTKHLSSSTSSSANANPTQIHDKDAPAPATATAIVLESLQEPVYVVCRYGNDSQGAVRVLKELGFEKVWDVVGGLERWAREVDPTFPRY